jgi:hypothetical protein
MSRAEYIITQVDDIVVIGNGRPGVLNRHKVSSFRKYRDIGGICHLRPDLPISPVWAHFRREAPETGLQIFLQIFLDKRKQIVIK